MEIFFISEMPYRYFTAKQHPRELSSAFSSDHLQDRKLYHLQCFLVLAQCAGYITWWYRLPLRSYSHLTHFTLKKKMYEKSSQKTWVMRTNRE